jgi:hypothetical protein
MTLREKFEQETGLLSIVQHVKRYSDSIEYVRWLEDRLTEAWETMKFTASDMQRAYDDGYSTEGEVNFDIENYR